jgi:hypothetical protein
MMVLPWTPKIVYGIFTDTFPLFGSRKRSYLIAMGLLQFLSALLVAVYAWETVTPVAILITFSALSGAVLDTVVDGLMVS